jgi:hypothetical protein
MAKRVSKVSPERTHLENSISQFPYMLSKNDDEISEDEGNKP